MLLLNRSSSIRYKSAFLILPFLISLLSQASPIEMPGLIPTHGERQQASDLIYQGQSLTPDEVTNLISQGVDASNINPSEATDLWKNVIGAPLDPKNYSLQLPAVAEFHFMSDLQSPIGTHRFTISAVDTQGVTRTYAALLGKTAHNILLRKALLEKLGYYIPEVQFIPQMRLHFQGAFSKKKFPENLNSNTFGAPELWINNLQDTTSDYYDVQDVILFSSTEHIYNLSAGYLLPIAIQGRRILNSILVAYNLTDVPESLNTLSWVPGRILNEGVYLPYAGADNFSTSFEDAKWIAKRIVKLTREDFIQIVKAASLPKEVSQLTVEKLVSRRNILIDLFKLKETVLPVDTHITSGTLLVDGKLTQKMWPGYASIFSFDTPDSPINGAEIGAFFRSRIFSTTISNGITEFNKQIFKSQTDKLQEKWLDHQFSLLRDQLNSMSRTGQPQKVPFQMYSIPTVSGGLILSREVVIGSFMGTDNLIQMADTFGYQLSPGYYLGFDGLTDPLQMTGSAGVQILRTYSHVKPIKSIRAVSKEKYSNMLVPYFQSQIEKGLSSVLANPTNPPSAEDLKRLEDVAKLLKDNFGVGESIIISDNYTLNLSLNAGYPMSVNTDIQARLQTSTMLVRRLQIFKKDENTIQVYKDPALAANAGISFSMNAFRVPILTISWNKTKGTAQTDFYSVSSGSGVDTAKDGTKSLNDPNAFKSLQALYRLFNESEVDLIQADQKPITIKHKFSQNSFGLGFFVFQNRNQTNEDNILLQNRDGYQKSFLTRTMSQRSGVDYQTLVLNTLQSIIQDKTGYANIKIDDTGSGNPGDTLYGKAITRTVNLEAEQIDNNPNSALAETYVAVTHNHRGWQISNHEALEILEKFNKQFGTNLTWPGMINDTKKFQLYNINLKIAVYNAGLEYLARVSPDQLKHAFQISVNPALSYSLNEESTSIIRPDSVYRTDLFDKLRSLQRKYLKAQAAGDGQEQAETALQLVNAAEMYFPGKELIALVGGEDNLFVQAQIQGFRDGDESASDPKTDSLNSNTIGIIGSRKFNGPLHFVQSNLGISEGEFFINWLMNRL